MLSLLEAANRTGKTKPTLLKAIKRGRLTAAKDEAGQWRLDPAELFRVYPPVNDQGTGEDAPIPAMQAIELAAVRRERDLLQAQVDDLRQRLDQSEAERREKDRQLTALLTDQRPQVQPQPEPVPPPRRGLRGWLHRMTA